MRAVLKTLALLAVLVLTGGCAERSRGDTDEISRHISAILQLPTYEHVYRDVVYLSRERAFLIFKTMDAEVLFAINVRIQAGVDLREGFSVKRRREGVLVQLPPAKILLADADEESIEQYFLKEIGGGIARLEYYDEINSKKAELIEDAVRRGILLKADENAGLLIRGFLENLLGENVTVVTLREPAR